jgi:hypothetical protein
MQGFLLLKITQTAMKAKTVSFIVSAHHRHPTIKTTIFIMMGDPISGSAGHYIQFSTVSTTTNEECVLDRVKHGRQFQRIHNVGPVRGPRQRIYIWLYAVHKTSFHFDLGTLYRV